MNRRNFKKFVGNVLLKIALVVLSLLLCLCCAEVWVHYTQPLTIETRNVTIFAQQLLEEDELLGWKNRKNFSGIFRQSNVTTYVTTNSLGMRGSPEIAIANEKKSILILGDSQTWGYGLNDDDTFSHILQDMLGEEFAVFNAGVLGYGLDQELLWLQRMGKVIKPELIIVTINLNDLSNISNKQQYHLWKPIYKIDEAQLVLETKHIDNEYFFEAKGMRPLLLKFASLYWFFEKFTRLKASLSFMNKKTSQSTAHYSLDWMVLNRNPNQRILSTWLLAEYIIREMKICVSDLGAELMVVPLPFIESVSPNFWQQVQKQLNINPEDFDLDIFFRRFKKIAENENLLFFDPLPKFLKCANSMEFFSEYHYHFNALGHQKLAEELYETISKYQLF